MKYFEMNKDEVTTYQNVWDAAKVVLTRKVLAADTDIK